MRKVYILISLAALLLAACGPQPSPEPTAEQPPESLPSATAPQPTVTRLPTDTPQPATEQPAPTPTPTVEQPTAVPVAPTEVAPSTEHPGLPLPTDREDLFSASGACSVCHTGLEDEASNDVSTDTLWRASMMANAARDPYWQAAVRGEVLSNPAYQAIIEDKCATCHMPLAHFTVVAEEGQGAVLDAGFLDAQHTLHALAMDGISCTLCHQIREEGLGEPDSFGGGFSIDVELPTGEREAFGPHPVAQELAQIMQGSSGYAPIQSPHIEESGHCATCHTLYTPYLDSEGQIAGVFPEQTAYLEWQASSFSDTISCQGCHMPPAEGGVQLSITGGPLREPFHQHIFAGGNVYMLEILRTFGEELAVTASSAQFLDKERQVAQQLQKRTASITISEAGIEGSTLEADVSVASMVGHKLPTGFPARRVWIHLVVQDRNGEIVLESGAVNPDGSIVGNDNDSDPAAYEPHYLTIDNGDQVQIYESVMGTTEGEVTTILLKGAGYLKDNRLLPAGLNKDAAHQDIAVHGAAQEDEDFAAGGDRVHYSVDLGEAPGPFTVTAELMYQSIGFRWAANLRAHKAPEPSRFVGYYEQVTNRPVLVASATIEVAE